ncbi:MAG: zf-HC2 domain-containing protein [Gemmatimonadaceae bacterium]
MTDELSASEPASAIPEECLAVVRHLWDLLDDELTDAQATRLRRHIGECDICRRYHLYQENFLDELAAYRARYGAPSRVKARVLESLREAGFVEVR